MARILIVGASQGIGLECVTRALSGGHEVRALARHADRIAIEDPRLLKISADARSQADIARALEGVDAVIEALGIGRSLEALFAGTDLFSAATRVLVDQMVAHNVHRLVAVTGLGAGDSRGHGGFLYDYVFMPVVLKRVYDDKDVQEMIIRRSGLDWTIVRPGVLTSGPTTGHVRALVEPREWRMGRISRADVADFVVREVEAPHYIGKAPVVIA